MADPTAELLVKIGTDTRQLKTGLDRADKQVGGFANTIKKHHKAIGIAMTAAGAAILAFGVKSVLTFAQMGDEVAKMAKRTGFSTEALSELRHAAQLSGASLAGLEKASRTLSGAILDAGFGLETYVRSFDQLGLSYESLAKLSPEEQFMAVMEALAKVENESTRAALATDLFGRAGTQLLPMLADGAEGLADMRQEAHDLGIVFDLEAAKKAEAFNDAITKLKGAVSGIMIQVGGFIADALKPMIDTIKVVIAKIGDWMKEHPALAKVITTATMVIGALLVVLGPLLIMLPGIIAALPLLGAAFAALIGPVGIVIAIIAALIAIGVLVWKNWDVISAKAKEIWNAIAGFFSSVWGTITSIFREHWDKILAILFPAIGIPILIARNWDKVKEVTVTVWNSIVGFFKGVWDSIKKGFASVGNAIWGGIQSGINKAISAINSLINLINKIPFVKVPKIPSLGEEVEGVVKKVETALPPEPSPPGEPALGQPYFPRYFQHGGIVTKPTLAVIGEAGPEAVVPLDRMGGLTINFNEPVFMEREESINKLADRIYRVIKKEQRLSFGAASG